MSAVAIIAALVMGYVLGLLGGGGSILAVPILVYLLGIEAKAAIATSLLVVGATSAFAAISHARAGNVIWRTGLVFGLFAMMGAFGGGLLSKYIPGQVLLVGFGLLMLITAVAMLRKKVSAAEARTQDSHGQLPLIKIAAEGLVVGAITGLVGAGGGFMVVPALTLLGGLSMRHAIGTSLMVIAMKSFAAFAGYAGHVDIDWNMVMIFVLASLVGTVLGAWSAKRIDAAHLRTGFAWFVLVMGVFIVLQKSGIVQLDKRPAAPQVQTTGAAEGPKAHASSALSPTPQRG